MFKFRNVVISVSLMLLVMLPLASCSVMDWVNNQNMVITTIEQVQDGKKGEAVILPTDKIPEEYRTSWKDKVVVMAPRESLKANSTLFVPMSSDSSMWGGDAIMSLAQGALSIGSTFIPQLAGFEAILLLLFKRKIRRKSKLKKLRFLSIATIIGGGVMPPSFFILSYGKEKT